MLVMGYPQFPTQDDFGVGNGIDPIPQWQLGPARLSLDLQDLDNLNLDPAISNILGRLRNIFHESRISRLSTADLHDLTCFVVHRLLLLPSPSHALSLPSILSDCLRYAMIVYMLTIHGPTYYSHAEILNSATTKLKGCLQTLLAPTPFDDTLRVWLFSVGMVASMGTKECQWFMEQAAASAIALNSHDWDDLLVHLKTILWLEIRQGELFRQKWVEIFARPTSYGGYH